MCIPYLSFFSSSFILAQSPSPEGVEERGYWGGQDLILIMLDRHKCFSVFHHLQKDKQRKLEQRHSLKLGKKRRESSKRNHYIISPRVIIKAIIVIWGSHRVRWASKFQKDTVFILVVKRNSIGSPAVEGGDFLGSQDDVLSGVKFGVIISQTSNPGKQT